MQSLLLVSNISISKRKRNCSKYIFFLVEALRCYSCTGQNNSPCYLGNSSSPNMVLTNCTIGSSHCYATTSSKFTAFSIKNNQCFKQHSDLQPQMLVPQCKEVVHLAATIQIQQTQRHTEQIVVQLIFVTVFQ